MQERERRGSVQHSLPKIVSAGEVLENRYHTLLYEAKFEGEREC
jgi:hypothetical protein